MAKRQGRKQFKRPETIDGAPLQYAPENELGVVFLFSHIAKKYRMKIEQIRAGFPDCVAYQKTGDGDKRVRIEFEFESRSFKTHGHSAKDCDWIVCWEHNWPDIPKRLKVIELRNEYGLGFNIWIQAVGRKYKEALSEYDYCKWTVPSRAREGDLLLFYRNRPDMYIKDIFRMTGPAKLTRIPISQRGDWTPKSEDLEAPLRCVCRLKSPIFLEDLKKHRILSTAGFVRAQMQGRSRITEHWPYLYDMIVRRNPSVRKKLQKYAPDII